MGTPSGGGGTLTSDQAEFLGNAIENAIPAGEEISASGRRALINNLAEGGNLSNSAIAAATRNALGT